MEPTINTPPDVSVSRTQAASPLTMFWAIMLITIIGATSLWLEYTLAPETIVEVEKVPEKPIVTDETEQNLQAKSELEANQIYTSNFLSSNGETIVRKLLSRQELMAGEKEFMRSFNLSPSHELYSLGRRDVYTSHHIFQDKGISFLVPYNEGWGWPHYRLSPYEYNKDGKLLFGGMNSCPAGCLDTGAVIYGYLDFEEPGLADAIVDSYMKEQSGDEPKCEDITIKGSSKAKRCHAETLLSNTKIVIEGTRYTYVFSGAQFNLDFPELIIVE
jgi:hypothetical protein